MVETVEQAFGGRGEKKGPGRPRGKQPGLDSTGLKHQGPGSWLQVRFHKKARKRDHRKLSLLVETRQQAEKFIYDWRLDRSRVADVSSGRKVLSKLPENTDRVVMDPAYDAKDIYEQVERQGGRAVVKPRRNARTGQVNARGRSLRRRLKYPSRWRREYRRRVICEAGNYALKRRFGERLWSHGLWRQRREMALRVLVYNANMRHRRVIRRFIEEAA